MHSFLLRICILSTAFFTGTTVLGQTTRINNDTENRHVHFANPKISGELDYDKKLNIAALRVGGHEVIAGDSGVYSFIKTAEAVYSSLRLLSQPTVAVKGGVITVDNIIYGDAVTRIAERWSIAVMDTDIQLRIQRTVNRRLEIMQAGFPRFTFKDINTWTGAYQDYGGLAWFYLFNRKLEDYGVHSASAVFWNAAHNDGLSISVAAPGRQVVSDYNLMASGKLAYNIAVSPSAFAYRFDSGTRRRRFIRDTTAWVWNNFIQPAGVSTQTIVLSPVDMNARYGRGKLAGIDDKKVNAVLNTIARIGVIDKQHFGANSWHTPYGPICLHEQYIAQLGLAINDPAYLSGYRATLDFYRDHAIKPNGRVWPRWAYSNEDMMGHKVNSEGFYEAQWGYLLDSNPDYVTNVAELYDQNGDVNWVKTHQLSCEKALNWILARDENKNGLVEMMTNSTAQKRGSDWIDIIWAAYENAFVNAKLYHALVLWSAIEKQLHNSERSKYYAACAARLKASFNKPVAAGGFWDEQNQCYIHWRDKDGCLHGRNMVTPVNFMAIAYGICSDDSRQHAILDNIETQMEQEDLFFWPLCMKTYASGEGNDWQFPFPNYENGDLFLSWGALGVKAYAAYKPELALKYVKNVLNQYAKDGLAFQRYGRSTQKGLGDDILSGNALSIVGLYQSIYGINPLYNRFYLDPHITAALAGTELQYRFRGKVLTIGLKKENYTVSDGHFSITSNDRFGFNSSGHELLFFKGDNEEASVRAKTDHPLSLRIGQFDNDGYWWQQTAGGYAVRYTLARLQKSSRYDVMVDGVLLKSIVTGASGSMQFSVNGGSDIKIIPRKSVKAVATKAKAQKHVQT